MGSSDDDRQRLVALERELARLKREVEQLRAAADGARAAGKSSMAVDCRCPACGGRKILHAREVLDRSEGGRSKLALAQPSIWREKGVGEFEVFVCTDCGLCEWHVKDLDAVQVDEDRFRLLEPEDPAGPYR